MDKQNTNKKGNDKIDKINKIIDALKEVSPESNNMIMEMAKDSSENQLVEEFNQISRDFFEFIVEYARRRKEEKVYDIDGYYSLFKTALVLSKYIPIDQFSIIVLQFAHKVYAKDEKYILDINIPDQKIKLDKQNEFSLLQSEKFKSLWKSLKGSDKDKCGDFIMNMTIYSHAYFFKTVISVSK